MKLKILASVLIGAGVLAAGVYGAYAVGMKRGMGMTGGAVSAETGTGATEGAKKAGDIDPSTGKKVLYWHDPMVPGQKFDKPGKSPFMDMQLVAVYAEGDGDQRHQRHHQDHQAAGLPVRLVDRTDNADRRRHQQQRFGNPHRFSPWYGRIVGPLCAA